VFSADLHEAISANPLIQFHLVAKNSGTLEFIWHEDGGQVYTTTRELRVL
ncbi:MAG TPA: thiosulfate oxidation carrier complex protein SoxZ, partial [Candidatus Lambdaproteobacteria bacterium]|nr:thiosulfate oxidation carrier complex protein SoxZ [Candidatus Lambdaproteobacteria bacterium]